MLRGRCLRLCVVFSVAMQAQSAFSQAPAAGAPQAMGVNTGGTYAPVLDAQKRPITAGGFVKTGPVIVRVHVDYRDNPKLFEMVNDAGIH